MRACLLIWFVFGLFLIVTLSKSVMYFLKDFKQEECNYHIEPEKRFSYTFKIIETSLINILYFTFFSKHITKQKRV